MRKKCICLLLLLCSAAAFAQPSGSGGGSFANAYLIPTIVCAAGTFGAGTDCTTTGGGQSGILWANIQVPTSKNVLLMASLETSLLTETLVSSSGGTKSFSSAQAAVVVTPHLYPCTSNGPSACSTLGAEITGAVTPSVVTFNEREQTLSASLNGICTQNLTTLIITCTTPETIDLILSTTSANSFNFFVDTPSQGAYQIQLGIGTSASGTTNSLQAGSKAMVGVGAGSLVDLVVQQVTPNTSLTLCGGTANSGIGQSCGP
jgi:hypothetical protein